MIYRRHTRDTDSTAKSCTDFFFPLLGQISWCNIFKAGGKSYTSRLPNLGWEGKKRKEKEPKNYLHFLSDKIKITRNNGKKRSTSGLMGQKQTAEKDGKIQRKQTHGSKKSKLSTSSHSSPGVWRSLQAFWPFVFVRDSSSISSAHLSSHLQNVSIHLRHILKTDQVFWSVSTFTCTPILHQF